MPKRSDRGSRDQGSVAKTTSKTPVQKELCPRQGLSNGE